MSNTARNWIGIVGVCLVFVLGMVAGAALMVQVERARAEKLLFSGHFGDALTDRLTRLLTARLHCDIRQREEIRAILLDAQQDMRAARRQIAPQLRQVFFQAAGRVRGVLHGDQLKTFEEIMARIAARQRLTETVSAAVPVSPSLPTSRAPVLEASPASR